MKLKTDKTDLPLRATGISTCNILLTYTGTALFKDGAHKHKRMIESRIFYGTRPLNMTEYDFSHVHV